MTVPLQNGNLQDKQGIALFSQIRRHRLMQICSATALGLLASLLVARGITFYIFAAGLASLLLALGLAFKHKVMASAFTLLVSMSAMLFAFALTGAGLFDLAILGYPGLLIFAAILGGVRLFTSVLVFIIAQCVGLSWLTLQGIITPNIPSLSWSHLIFILVILTVTGFSVYILVRDIKQLTLSLQAENAKVQANRIKLEYLAHHDRLTNLPNRLYGESLFSHSLLECQKNQQQLALLFIDLDNFKPVNDALGHEAGDTLLQQLAQRLQEKLESNHSLIRFGGDEFLILAPINEDNKQLDELAESLIEQCASVFEILQTQVVVSASLGIAKAPEDGVDFKQLCRKADIAMYRAKRDGRNTYHHYDPSLDKASDDKFKMLQRLRPALTERQFELYYQPMIDLQNGHISTVEALIRWPQPDGSMIGPDHFIPIAEASGLINELGNWVLREACLFCAKERERGLPKLCVAVNLSVIQFNDGQLQNIVKRALRDANLPAEALELELTESLLVNDADHIQSQLVSLSQLGVSIAIDDFGTGYSNLGYLRDFNAGKLKIDRSFIHCLTEQNKDEALVKAIISMAHSLGLKTVAEGVEDKETLEKLRELGCDIGQGYFWSKPVPDEALHKYLSASQ